MISQLERKGQHERGGLTLATVCNEILDILGSREAGRKRLCACIHDTSARLYAKGSVVRTCDELVDGRLGEGDLVVSAAAGAGTFVVRVHRAASASLTGSKPRKVRRVAVGGGWRRRGGGAQG